RTAPQSPRSFLLLATRLLRRERHGLAERARRLHLGDAAPVELQHAAQDFLGVLAEQGGTLHLADRIRHLDRVADREIFAARRMIDLDDRAGLAQRFLL